jgi:hypothetical protein
MGHSGRSGGKRLHGGKRPHGGKRQNLSSCSRLSETISSRRSSRRNFLASIFSGILLVLRRSVAPNSTNSSCLINIFPSIVLAHPARLREPPQGFGSCLKFSGAASGATSRSRKLPQGLGSFLKVSGAASRFWERPEVSGDGASLPGDTQKVGNETNLEIDFRYTISLQPPLDCPICSTQRR